VNRIAPGLLVLFLTASIQAATPTVLIDTGWEPVPADPAWVTGPVAAQNGWADAFYAPPTFVPFVPHTVVSNGSPAATVGGQAVVTPYGTQFHKFICSTNTSDDIVGLAYADISGAVAALTPPYKINVSMDMFVPSSQTNVQAGYGFFAIHDGGSGIPWAFEVDPTDQSVNILTDLTAQYGVAYQTGSFPIDKWFNVVVTADYSSGEISVAVNGTNMPEATATSATINDGVLTDVDLAADNFTPSAPPLRVAFSDNFRVTAETIVGGPTLSIAPDPAGGWTLSWSAAFPDWYVEAAPAPDGPWATEPTDPPVIANVMASVNVNEPPNVFYRLHKP